MSFETLLEKYQRKGKWPAILEEPEISKTQRIYQLFANHSFGARAAIDSFNSWVTTDLKKQFASKNFYDSNGNYIEFIDAVVSKPFVIDDKGIKRPIFPNECRANKIPYSGQLTVTYRKSFKNSDKTIEKKVVLGEIPIVIKSKLCHLNGLTPEECVAHGECISTTGGNVIISSEKMAVIQEKLRVSLPLITIDDGIPQMSVINFDFGKGSIRTMFRVDSWNAISINIGRVMMKDKTDKYLPIFHIFSIVLPEEKSVSRIIKEYILPFVPEEHRTNVSIFLQSSVIEYNRINDLEAYVKKNNIFQEIPGNWKAKKEIYARNILENIFHHAERENYDDKQYNLLKLYTLGQYIAKFCLCVIGIIKIDNRGNWSNKRFEACGKLMLELFNSLLGKLVEEMELSDHDSTFKSFYDSVKGTYKKSFNGPLWGAKGGYMKEGVSEQYHNSTPMEQIRSVAKTNVPTSRRNKNKEIREVDPSQHCSHCPTETPDSESISLVKYQTACCILSKYEYSQKITEIVRDMSNKEVKNYTVLYDGVVIMKENKVCFVEDARALYNSLVELRRRGEISKTTEIYIDENIKTVEIYTDDSRPAAPFFIVDPEAKDLVINVKNMWNSSIKELLKNGCIEYLTPREKDNVFIVIATSYDEYLSKKDYGYTHCMLDPIEMFSVSTACCPFSNHQPSPRTTYQGGMNNQQLGFYSLNHFEHRSSYKILANPRLNLSMTIADFMPRLDMLPVGQTVLVAFKATPLTQEDSVEISESCIRNGNYSYHKYSDISYAPTSHVGVEYTYCKPVPRKNESESIYHAIQENGLPKIGAYIKEGDCVIGVMITASDGRTINSSVMAGVGKKGYVVKVNSIMTEGKSNRIEVKLRYVADYKAGDKTAFRYSQKRTVARIVPPEEMIRVRSGPNKGVPADVIFNSHSVPSRSTIGMMIEGILSKAALYSGKKINATAFVKHDIDEAMRILEENGLRGDGTEEFEYPDGTPIEGRIFFVPLLDCPLKHQTDDKIQARDFGKLSQMRQPVAGRENAGGIRFGEMERAVINGQGASQATYERMCSASDAFTILICGNQTCGRPIISDILDEKEYVPMCNTCNSPNVKKVIIPYASWIYFYILKGCGIDVQLRTD